MIQIWWQAIGRAGLIALTLTAIALSGPDQASATSSPIDDTPVNAQPKVSGNGRAPEHTVSNSAENPKWNGLKPSQQQALAPLAAEWNSLPASQKKKWLAISARFPSLSADQQLRMQERMRDWIALTPAQRRVARENYSLTKKLGPDRKAAEWQQYQQLSDEQKKKLADEAAKKKNITNLPPATQAKGKLIPPPKPPRGRNIAPAPNAPLEKEAGNHSSPQPSIE